MNKLLITPREVLELAFGAGEYLPPECITDELIRTAAERYARPVAGGRLLEAIASGGYADLKEEYLAPVLALGVKLLLLPELNIQIGACSLAATGYAGWKNAEQRSVERALKSVKVRLKTLQRRLSDELEQRHEEIPEYDSGENILNRCRIYGDLVQVL